MLTTPMLTVRTLTARTLKNCLLAVLVAWGGGTRARAQMASVPATPRPTGNCTHPDPSTRPDCRQAIDFLAMLQKAVRDDRPAEVAPLLHYPLLVTAGGERRISGPADLIAGYHRIFHARLRAAILAATPDDVWGNSHGFMIARGALWFESFRRAGSTRPESATDLRVITINPVYP